VFHILPRDFNISDSDIINSCLKDIEKMEHHLDLRWVIKLVNCSRIEKNPKSIKTGLEKPYWVTRMDWEIRTPWENIGGDHRRLMIRFEVKNIISGKAGLLQKMKGFVNLWNTNSGEPLFLREINTPVFGVEITREEILKPTI